MLLLPLQWQLWRGIGEMPLPEVRTRTNGFQRPLHPLQMLSWVVVSLDVILFSLFGIPLIEAQALKVCVAVCFGTSIVVLVLAAIQATGVDPADPHIRRQDHGVQVNKDEDEKLPYCVQCDSPVFQRSKHCRACNKCVREFDHHCMWVNNCVGASNYRAFATCIGAVAVMTFNILGVSAYLFLDYFINGEEFELRVEDYPVLGDTPREVVIPPLCFLIIVNLPFFVLDMQLVILHIFLTWQNVTTFEYIMNKRVPEGSDSYEDGEGTGNGSSKPTIRRLPKCFDWILDCRKRRRRSKNSADSQKANADSRAGSDSETAVVGAETSQVEEASDDVDRTSPAVAAQS